jgi:hypothetical protein
MRPPGRQYAGAAFFPDGKRLLITTKATGQVTESAVEDLDSGAVRSFGKPGRHLPVSGFRLFPGPSPDGRFSIETDGTNHYWLQPIDGGEAKEISGVRPAERIIGWRGDSNNLLLSDPTGADTEVYDLNLATGTRTLWVRFSPPEKLGFAARTYFSRLMVPALPMWPAESTPTFSWPTAFVNSPGQKPGAKRRSSSDLSMPETGGKDRNPELMNNFKSTPETRLLGWSAVRGDQDRRCA